MIQPPMKYIVISIILISGAIMIQCAYTDAQTAGTDNSGQQSEHVYTSQLIDGEYYGGTRPMDGSFTDFVSTTWDFLFSGSNRTPDVELPRQPVDLSHFNNPGEGQLSATWIGHSSLLINIDGYRILTDPVFEKRVSIFGPTRFNGEVPLDIGQIAAIDAVIISHDHYDHLNRYSIDALNSKTHRFVVPMAVGDRLVKWGVPRAKIVELDWWEEYRFDQHLMIAATPAQHFSGRGLTDRNKTLWASWVVATPGHKLFFSGDSGYFDGFKQIGGTYGPFDLTFIECGAYNTAWAKVHMFPEETVQAHIDLGGKVLHPIHWGTFNLALHPWYEPMERLTTAADAAQVETATPMVGGTTDLYRPNTHTQWWRRAIANDKSTITDHSRLKGYDG
jgi:L-ascorbate metabolism protein UlaG (beta-lactamase superfamily)